MRSITVQTFFFVCAGFNPFVNTFLTSFEVAAKEPAVAISFKNNSATLAGYAVVVTYSLEMLTIAHVANRLYHFLLAVKLAGSMRLKNLDI